MMKSIGDSSSAPRSRNQKMSSKELKAFGQGLFVGVVVMGIIALFAVDHALKVAGL